MSEILILYYSVNGATEALAREVCIGVDSVAGMPHHVCERCLPCRQLARASKTIFLIPAPPTRHPLIWPTAVA